MFERDRAKIILIKSYQVQQVMESHDRQPPDRTHRKEKEPGKNYLKLISFLILSLFFLFNRKVFVIYILFLIAIKTE